MKSRQPDTHTAFIGIILVVLIAVLIAGCFVLYLQPKGRFTCESFGSYYDIPNNWAIVSPGLDGNHDGIPCNALYNKRN